MLTITHIITKTDEGGRSARIPVITTAEHIVFEGSFSSAFAITGEEDLIIKNRSIISIEHNN